MPIAATIGGALIQGLGAKVAADSQAKTGRQDIAFQKETRDIIRGDLAPYRTGGVTAQNAYDYELGLGARPNIGGTAPSVTPLGRQNALGQPQGRQSYRVNGQMFDTMEAAQQFANANMTGGTPYGGYTKTPGYDFRLQQGQDSIEASAAARGGLYSGAALKSALEYRQNYASNEYGNYMNELSGRANSGMTAAQMSGAASTNAASGVSNALGNIGNAQAAGAVGFGNAINAGITNGLGAWQYQKNLNAGMTPYGWNR